jgi:hypothetical protein
MSESKPSVSPASLTKDEGRRTKDGKQRIPKYEIRNTKYEISLSRRQLVVSMAALGGVVALRLPVPSLVAASPVFDCPCECVEGPTGNGSFFLDRDNWKRHGVAHFVNLFWPGDHGSVAFEGDETPFDARLPQVAPGIDPPDLSPGAYSACAINAFFDPYYTFEPQGGNLALISNLDWRCRVLECGPVTYFHKAGWAQQIQVNHGMETGPVGLMREVWEGAWLLTMATTLGAAHNYRVTNDMRWPGPADHYYHGTPEGSHVSDGWLRPVQVTSDGNLP